MFFLKKISNSKVLRPRSRYEFIFLAVFLFFAFTPLTASAQILVTDPISTGIQAIIQHLAAANTAIEAAESKIQTELSALTYARQGQQLMNQIQELQQESSTLLTSVNNIEGTVMMPAGELQGLKNSLTEEQTNMQNIIAQEKALGNPQMSQFLQNYANTYGGSFAAGPDTLLGAKNPAQYYSNIANKYSTANTQAAQTAGYAQSVLNNSQNNQHLISQLGANVAAAHGQVAAEQANGQALVALTEEVNQLNKLEAQQAKLKAMQAGTTDAIKATSAETHVNVQPPNPVSFTSADMPSGSSPFGTYPNVTNFGIGSK